MNKYAYLLGGLLLVALMASLPYAHNATAQVAKRDMWMLIVDKECTYEQRDQIAGWLRLNNTSQAHRMPSEYQVACFGGVEDLADLQAIIPVLRKQNPNVSFVFILPARMRSQFAGYMSAKASRMKDTYGENAGMMVMGYTDIESGVAYAMADGSFWIENVTHEISHLYGCGTFHDIYGVEFADGRYELHPKALELPWCY